MNDSVMVALKELRDLEDRRTREEAAKRLALVEAERRAREEAERRIAEERARERALEEEKAGREIAARKAVEDGRIADLERRLEAERRMRAEIEMRIVSGPVTSEAPPRSAGSVLGWVSAGIAAAAVGFAFFVMTREPPVVERVVEVPVAAPEPVARVEEPATASPPLAVVEPPAAPAPQTKRPPHKRPPVPDPHSVLPEITCSEDDPTCGI